jgi:8-oxo-dGTP pyrophosphatase MutT (NUDIX family)
MSSHNPWKTLSSRIVYQNPWIRVREDQVIRPDGNPGIYGVVETRIATGVVALDDHGQVYLVGQFRYATDEYSWEIIEGGSEESETALAAAMREHREEAGLVAEEWIQLGDEVHLSNCHSSEVAVFFLARKLRQTESSPDGTELLQIKKLPFSDALQMVDAGEVKDAMTIIGLIRASQFLKRTGAGGSAET